MESLSRAIVRDIAGPIRGEGWKDDFAKALREVIATLRDFANFVDDATSLYDRHKARAAAKGLAILAFGTGMRTPLERIANGIWRREDFDEIAQRLNDTAGEVEGGITSILNYRDRSREKFGLDVCLKLDAIINSESGKVIG